MASEYDQSAVHKNTQVAVRLMDREFIKTICDENAHIPTRITYMLMVLLDETVSCLLAVSNTKAKLQSRDEYLFKSIIERQPEMAISFFIDICNLLVGRGADPNHSSMKGWTLLTFAAVNNSRALVREVIQYKEVDPNRRNASGWCAILCAINTGAKDIVMYLLDHGADANSSNANGTTALHLAAQRNNDDIVRMLLEKGADPNIDAPNKFSLLFWPVRAKNISLVKVLLEHGTDPNRHSSDWQSSVLYQALQHNDPMLVYTLISKGANTDVVMYGGMSLVRKAIEIPVDKQIVAMFLATACNTSGIAETLSDPVIQDRMGDVAQNLRYYTTNPFPLRMLCRKAIRKSITTRKMGQLRQLPLPRAMIDFLCYPEFLVYAQNLAIDTAYI